MELAAVMFLFAGIGSFIASAYHVFGMSTDLGILLLAVFVILSVISFIRAILNRRPPGSPI